MHYTLIEELGHGGMGCVYKAEDTKGNIVAIKKMSNRVTCYPEYRELFKAEVETLKKMNYPSIVRIVGDPYSDAEGNLYLPMEYVEGETLEHRVFSKGPFSLDEAVELMSMILDAIQYVHNRQRIHRDIKPSNIMLRPNGEICVIDFGIAKDACVGSSGKTVGRVIGTDGYMSPEQANGYNIDHRTDIYSLGCVFFFLLTGKHAVQKGANDYATVANILKGEMLLPSQLVASIPPAIDNVFLKSVDKNMMRRYQSALSFKEALEVACGNSVPKISVGSSSDNDIIISSQYVSRHHLVISGLERPLTGGAKKYTIELTDDSLNGTGVDGRPLKKTSMEIDYNGTSFLPEVLLAARSECPLDWDDVVMKLRQKGWNPDLPKPIPTPLMSQRKGCLEKVFFVFSIILPLIALIKSIL